tara:strand:+ start:2838 stop:3788 length:951 start_codon:yes stop_codon:yes gene_type:complete
MILVMEYRNLGQSGLKVSAVSLGGWLTQGGSVDDKTAIECVHFAFENGINFFDTADVYSQGKSEIVLGKAITEMKRSDLVISSKVFGTMSENVNDRGLSRKHIIESCEKSLERLGTDYLDIYFCHRYDDETPLEETVRAMSDLVSNGMIHYWGTSVWASEQMRNACAFAEKFNGYSPQVEQPHYNMLERGIEEDQMLTASSLGMGLTVWSPLAGGMLTGKYNSGSIPKGTRAESTEFLNPYMNEETFQKIEKLELIAKDVGCTLPQLALSWILRKKEVSSAIIGVTNLEQLKENISNVDFDMSKDLIGKITSILGK